MTFQMGPSPNSMRLEMNKSTNHLTEKASNELPIEDTSRIAHFILID